MERKRWLYPKECKNCGRYFVYYLKDKWKCEKCSFEFKQLELNIKKSTL